MCRFAPEPPQLPQLPQQPPHLQAELPHWQQQTGQLPYHPQYQLPYQPAPPSFPTHQLPYQPAPQQSVPTYAQRPSRQEALAPPPPMREASVIELRSHLRKSRARVIDAFRCLDKDGSGAVSKREFRSALPILGFLANAETADAIFRELDLDHSGQIDFDELNKKLRQGQDMQLSAELRDGARGAIDTQSTNVIALRATPRGGQATAASQQQQPTVAELRAAVSRHRDQLLEMFKACDADRNGKITRREFRAVLPMLGFEDGGKAAKAVASLFKTFDLDGSGYVDYAELRMMLRYEAARESLIE